VAEDASGCVGFGLVATEGAHELEVFGPCKHHAVTADRCDLFRLFVSVDSCACVRMWVSGCVCA